MLQDPKAKTYLPPLQIVNNSNCHNFLESRDSKRQQWALLHCTDQYCALTLSLVAPSGCRSLFLFSCDGINPVQPVLVTHLGAA